MKLHALLAPALLLAGCTAVPPTVVPAPPPMHAGPMMGYAPEHSGLRFTVEPRIAAPGATVTLVLDNGTAHEVGYNLCGAGLEAMQPGTWRGTESGVCTRELRIVAAGQQARYERRLPSTIAPGQYRFTTGIEFPLNRGTPGLDRIYSETFTVRR